MGELDTALEAARRGDAEPLTSLLASPPQEAHRERWVRGLLEAVDRHDLRRRHQGRSLAAHVIQAVIDCGHPWAMQVTPEQLELLRNDYARQSPWVMPVLIGGALAYFVLVFLLIILG